MSKDKSVRDGKRENKPSPSISTVTTASPRSPKAKSSAGARVMVCACDSSYQDSFYGRRLRVHNSAKDATWRCTVCGTTRGAVS